MDNKTNEFNWTETENNIFKTTIDTAIAALFVEDKEMVMARWPNAQFSDKSIYSWDTWLKVMKVVVLTDLPYLIIQNHSSQVWILV